MENLTIFP